MKRHMQCAKVSSPFERRQQRSEEFLVSRASGSFSRPQVMWVSVTLPAASLQPSVWKQNMQRHPARREVDSRPQWPRAAHVESASVVDPKRLKLRTLPVGYCYCMHTQMSTAVRSACTKWTGILRLFTVGCSQFIKGFSHQPEADLFNSMHITCKRGETQQINCGVVCFFYCIFQPAGRSPTFLFLSSH